MLNIISCQGNANSNPNEIRFLPLTMPNAVRTASSWNSHTGESVKRSSHHEKLFHIRPYYDPAVLFHS